ncbi:MAG: hypothetical protein ABSB41_03125 [Anaerolineales bacterium]
MNTAFKAARMIVRITGSLQIVLGVLLWFGLLEGLVLVHILSGAILVLGLWVLAVLGARSGVKPGQVGLALVWGLVALLLGLTQKMLLIGPAHWVIRVLHLLIGLGAIGLAEMLAPKIGRGALPARPA